MPDRFRFLDFELDPVARALRRKGRPISLGARAFDVLLVLVEAAGELVTKESLLSRAWTGLIVEEANVHVQVASLRKVLGSASIATVAGLGYRFAVPVQVTESLPIGDTLPAEQTAFVGREAVLSDVQTRLARSRLVTLTGMGGTGKTRLALRLAQLAAGQWQHGVRWVDLAPLSSIDQLVQAFSKSVHCTVHGSGAPIVALQEFLRDRHLLVVLDNAEHLVAPVSEVVRQLLAGVPRLSLLITSREALGLEGESVQPIPPLAVPHLNAPIADIARSESVQLLVDRAQLQSVDFKLDDENAAAVAAVCRGLDGIPLAVELVAVQLRVMEPDQLRELLTQRLRFHLSPRPGRPAEQTLQAVVQWSYDRLAASEQQLLRTLSVFRGGCDLNSIKAVCADLPVVTLVEGLNHLLDQSLVIVRHGKPATRYLLLETVRQFGLEKLAECEEALSTNERHARHYLEFAEAQAGDYGDPSSAKPVVNLEAEQENIHQALEWFIQAGDPSSSHMALRLAVAMRSYWSNTGTLALGLNFTSSALHAARTLAPDRTYMHALLAAGFLQMHCRQLEDATLSAQHLRSLVDILGGDIELARWYFLRASIYRERGEYEESAAAFREQFLIGNRLDNDWHRASALQGLAGALLCSGKAAEALHEQFRALEIYRRLAEPGLLAMALINAASAANDLGTTEQAAGCLREAIVLLRSHSSRILSQGLLDIGAQWAAACGDWATTTTLDAASRMQRRGLGMPFNKEMALRSEQILASAKAALESNVYAQASSDGERLDHNAALDFLARRLGI